MLRVETRAMKRQRVEAEAKAKAEAEAEASVLYDTESESEADEKKHEMQVVLADWRQWIEWHPEDWGRYPRDWNIWSRGPHKTIMDKHRIDISMSPPQGDIRAVFEEMYRRVGTDMCPTKVRWMIAAGEYQTAFILRRLRYHRLWKYVNLRFEDRSYNGNGLRTIVVMTTLPNGARDNDGNLLQVQTWQETVDKYTNHGNEGPMHSPEPKKRLEAQSIVHAFEDMKKEDAKAIEMKGQEAYDRLQDGQYNMCPDALAQWEAAPMLSKLT